MFHHFYAQSRTILTSDVEPKNMVGEQLEEWIVKEGDGPLLWDVRDVREGAI